eukprot:TRINITY_DN47_c0_g1_i1.p1 TRINITY_DN47_c0_g1~~TRINITY_DN47_c0_g1_i1.p1  ORF type:complete len:2009 (+),score=485.82 TRINITY_DN47_c0_g1_i1:73-6099(+)
MQEMKVTPARDFTLPEGKVLSSWDQLKIILRKNYLLKTRSLDQVFYEAVVPFLAVLLSSILVIVGTSDSFETNSFYPASVRDSSAIAFLYDRVDDPLGRVFKDREGYNQHVGRVLFAPATADGALQTAATNLCNGIMTDMYNEVTAAKASSAEYDPISISMQSGTACASLVYDNKEQLDDAATTYAKNGEPIVAGVVLNAYPASDKVDYSLYLNRSLTYHLNEDGYDTQSFYPSAINLQYSGQGLLTLQRYVDQYFIRLAGSASTLTLSPYFKSMPHESWEYNTFKFIFLKGFFPLIVGFNMIFALKVMVSSVLLEKKQRIKEGMLMMGLSPHVFWLSWILTYMMVFLWFSFSVTVAVYILVFRVTNPLIFFSFFALFGFSVVALGILITTLFQDPGIGAITSVFILLAGIFTPNALTVLSRPLRLGLSVFSPFGFYWAMEAIALYEAAGFGVTFSNFASVNTGGSAPVKLWEFFVMMPVDCVIYAALAWYCDKVVPGEFGAKQRWYFLFSPSYWRGEQHSADDEEIDSPRSADVEPVPESLRDKCALKVERLCKVFYSNGIRKVAVSELSLEAYRGQITALLGHNGAGKTTTFNMLTGLIQPTSGDATLYGQSIVNNMAKIRSVLGTCPQHNVLWDNLTVQEHLKLFGALKGVEPDRLGEEVIAVVQQVGLQAKITQQSCTLSGGMKRKLSIAIALIGGSHLIFLDEPTSGMDPYSRRTTWTVIRNLLSRDPVLIFTTHFMDEADILGDRIAIMSHGQLRCCGSSLFLKRTFGLGYNLTLSAVVGQDLDWTPVEAIVEEHMQGAKVLSSAGSELSFQLPAENLARFPQLFRDLDEMRANVNTLLDSWGISITTLEEVFLTLAQEEERIPLKSSKSDDEELPGPTGQRLGDRETLSTSQQFFAHSRCLLKKRYLTTVRDSVNWLLIVAVPVLFIMISVIAVLYGFAEDTTGFGLNAGQYDSPMYLPYVGAAVPTSSASLATISNSATEIIPVSVATSGRTTPAHFSCSSYSTQLEADQAFARRDDDIEALTVRGLSTYTTTQTPITNPDTATPFYTGCAGSTDVADLDNYLLNTIDDQKTSRFGALIMNSVSTTTNEYFVVANGSAYHSWPTFANVANQAVLQARTASSASYLHVTVEALSQTSKEKADAERFNGVILVYFLILGFSIVPAVFVYSVVIEKVTKAKHLQLISGVNVFAYWNSMFLQDFCSYLLATACVLLIFIAFDVEAFFQGASFPAVLTLFLLYGLASIPQTYLMSFFFTDQNKALLFCIATYATQGFVYFFISFFLDRLRGSAAEVNDYLEFWFLLFPQYCISMGLYNLWEDYWAKDGSGDPWPWDISGKMIVFMSWEAVVLIVLVLVAQWRSTNHTAKEQEDVQQEAFEWDVDVSQEAALIDEGGVDPSSCPIVVQHLRKLYWTSGQAKPKVAVKDLSFHVPEGEVFGFLGINGAGKTSSLAILTGEFLPTSGSAALCGLDMFEHRDQINSQIGYCPQFDALFEHMTGREHLQLYARLKNVPTEQEDSVVGYLLQVMGLEDAADREAGGYSGGNKRKLSVAIALIGSPKIVFLDEPSTGMDPEARRFMWRVISSTMAGRSVILTTHSMEEVEALSHKIGIMVDGRLRCLGNKQHLKQRFGNGYTLELSIRDGVLTSTIESWMKENLPEMTLAEEQPGHLTYQAEETSFDLGRGFEVIQAAQDIVGIVNFSISQTTLEQVFNKFAADQEERHEDIEAASLEAAVRHFFPSVLAMCCCSPQKEYLWDVPDADGTLMRVGVKFNHGACVCCSGSNPGIVTINNKPVCVINEEGGVQEIVITGTTDPGCQDACCGCPKGCCGLYNCFCCSESDRSFKAHGRVLEIVPFNEVPCSSQAHPCMLFVDGVEAESGVKRNPYLEVVFRKASWKYCCVVGLPTFVVTMILFSLGAQGTGFTILGLIFLGLLGYCCAFCIVGNRCRSAHYASQADPEYHGVPHIEMSELPLCTPVAEPVVPEHNQPVDLQVKSDENNEGNPLEF